MIYITQATDLAMPALALALLGLHLLISVALRRRFTPPTTGPDGPPSYPTGE